MNWILLTFVSSFFVAVNQILEKILMKDRSSDPVAFSFVFQLIIAVMFLGYALVTGIYQQPSLESVTTNIIAMTLLYGVGSILIFYAYKTAEASEISIIFATSSLWSVLAARLLLGNQVTWQQSLGMGFIILSLIIVNFKKTTWNLGRGHVFALLGATMFGTAFANDAVILRVYDNIPSYMVLAFALPSFLTLLIKPSSLRNVGYFFKPAIVFRVLMCAITYAFAAISVFSAVKLSNSPAIVNMLRQSGIAFTVV